MFTVIGIVTTVIAAKIAMRAMRYRFYSRRGQFAGPCVGWHGRHHRWHQGWHQRWQRGAPFDLGNMDTEDYGNDFRGMGEPAFSNAPRVDTILKSLELNDRQASEAGDVIAVLRGIMGPERFGRSAQLTLALRAASRATFDADLAAAAIGSHVTPTAAKEAIDALEHLHTILTEEQRQALDRATARA